MEANTFYDKYEPVIGLEVHAQMQTKSKMYSFDSAEYGGNPNTHVSVISLGHPGTLPKVNKAVVESAVRLGLATNCQITEENIFARKNYFYADLPKGYQITQDKTPICKNGFIIIKTKEGKEKRIGITRIHMEEDAGKSIHDLDPFDTLIDLNRAGVPLLEIVSEPDIKTPEEAYNYLTEIRKLVRYLEICDGNMEEGSLRCDANISVMLKGSSQFGQRTEIKNINSIRNVQKAIEHEIKRQIEVIESGGSITMETRGFDALSGKTISMRTKEMAHDYRYFPEPDLLPIYVTQKDITEVQHQMPPLPHQLFHKYTKEFELSEYDATILTDSKPIALYFEELCACNINPKTAANWVMGAIKSYLNENATEIENFPISPKKIAELILLVEENIVSNSIAAQKIFPVLISQPEKNPLQIAQENNWMQESSQDALIDFVNKAIEMYPEKVAEYKNGKKGLLGLFMGEVMKLSKGKADPKIASKIIQEILEK